VGTKGATEGATGTTGATGYVDLSTAGPATTVTIPSSGNALVTVTGEETNSSNGSSSGTPVATYMGFAVSGNTTQAASDTKALVLQQNASENSSRIQVQASATYLVTLLAAGSNTFTAKYRVSTGTGTWVNRSIIVVPLP
jgi:hypothetical protein